MFAEERPALLPLPLEPFRYYQYGRRTVHLDGCVELPAKFPTAGGEQVEFELNIESAWPWELPRSPGATLRLEVEVLDRYTLSRPPGASRSYW